MSHIPIYSSQQEKESKELSDKKWREEEEEKRHKQEEDWRKKKYPVPPPAPKSVPPPLPRSRSSLVEALQKEDTLPRLPPVDDRDLPGILFIISVSRFISFDNAKFLLICTIIQYCSIQLQFYSIF